MTPEMWIAIIGTGGLAAAVPKVVDSIRALQSGRAVREKVENRSALARLTDAEEARDEEANFRRRVEEWAGRLVYMLVQMGVPVDQLPARPERHKERV